MDYRVWNIINVPGEADRYEVKSPKEGILLIEKMANQQLKNPRIQSNAFGIEYYDTDENDWMEWYDDDGFGENDYFVEGDRVIREFDGHELE